MRFAELPGPTRVAYEAGPTGFTLARALGVAGVQCVIAAPGKIERPAQDKVKTDRRDAERLVRLLMVDGLHPVRVPGTEEEALRDLVRAREDVRGDLMRARHRLGKLLLRHDIAFDGPGANWTAAHREWLGRLRLGDQGAQVTLLDYLGAVDALIVRRDALQATIGELVPGSPWAQTVARLRCLRGIDTLSAVGLCAEIGDWQRFERPGQLMSFLGGRAFGELKRREAQPRRDHEVWVSSRPPAARRGGLALPASASEGTHAAPPPTRSGAASDRAVLEGPAAPAPHLAPAQRRAWQATHDRRGRCRPRTRRVLLGDRERRLTGPARRRSRRRREQPGHHAREHPRACYEQPPPRVTLDPRRRALTTKPGPAVTSPRISA
jgi:Transposase/Transposase IS116/IS110/IS902 family